MLRPTAKEVKPLNDYKLFIVFDNGEKKYFDVKPYISGNWYRELVDPVYFKSVFSNGFTIEWANGQDICPDDLYYNSVDIDEVAPMSDEIEVIKRGEEQYKKGEVYSHNDVWL